MLIISFRFLINFYEHLNVRRELIGFSAIQNKYIYYYYYGNIMQTGFLFGSHSREQLKKIPKLSATVHTDISHRHAISVNDFRLTITPNIVSEGNKFPKIRKISQYDAADLKMLLFFSAIIADSSSS